MPWRTPNLPNEILGNVLVGLGVHDLTRTSLVSHSWQMLSFRYLYHTVYLTVADDLIRFSERLSHQHDNQLSIALYTRQLIIDRTFNSRARNCNRIVDEDDLQLLATIILKLTRLEHFAFKVGFAPHNPQLFQALRECRVKSFDWFIVEEPGTLNYFDDYLRLFDFGGLSHFSLRHFRICDGLFEEDLSVIISLIKACPNLESLVLTLREWDRSEPVWLLDSFFRALDSWTCPSLHTFRAHGQMEPDWLGSLSGDRESPARSFFRRHPGLQDIGLGWGDESMPSTSSPIAPDDMPVLFPSLRHLDAPAILCASVLASSLSKQIESVTVLDWEARRSTSRLPEIASTLSPMPRLRKLALIGMRDRHGWSFPVEALKTVLRAAPGLEELELNAVLDHPDEIVDVLKLVPNLRVLATRGKILSSLSHLHTDRDLRKWDVYTPVLAKICPLLRCVKDMDLVANYAYWVIDRDPEGSVVVNRRTSY